MEQQMEQLENLFQQEAIMVNVLEHFAKGQVV